MSDQEDSDSCYSDDEIQERVFESFDEALDENVKWWHRKNGNVMHYSFILSGSYTRNDVTGRDGMPLNLMRELNRHVITINGQPDLIGEDSPADLTLVKHDNREDLVGIPCHTQQRAYLVLICTPQQIDPIVKVVKEIGAYYVHQVNGDTKSKRTNYNKFKDDPLDDRVYFTRFDPAKVRRWLTRIVFATGDYINYSNVWKETDQYYEVLDDSVVVMYIFGRKTTKIRDLLQAVLNAVQEE